MSASVLKDILNSEIVVQKKMRSYNNEPVFKKKAEKAAAFLKKNGLPKDVSRKKK